MVECQLPKLKVASSSLVARSTSPEKRTNYFEQPLVYWPHLTQLASIDGQVLKKDRISALHL